MDFLISPYGSKTLTIRGKDSLMIVTKVSRATNIRSTGINDMKWSGYFYGPDSQVDVDVAKRYWL